MHAQPTPSTTRLRGIVAVGVGVSVGWVLLGVILGSQTALGMNMQGNPVVVGDAIRTAWVNNLPWIPATWVAIALALRFPLTRPGWTRTVWVHLAAIPAVSWMANVGVVLGFWAMAGAWQGWTTLARQAAFWGTVRLHVAALVYALAVALTHAWVWFRDGKVRELRVARLENQLANARLQALNAQIRPHFLFNTLHTIGQLWRSGRSDSAEEMLDRLGALFQRVRSTTEGQWITLDEELSMVEDYLAIEQARFADRLTVEVVAEPAARSCLVPPLILQPIVENAIRHGASAVEASGTVRVEARVVDDELAVTISDNGPGLEASPKRPGTGTGVANTRERLVHAFGGRGTLVLEPNHPSGVSAVLRQPAFDEADELAGVS